MEKSVLRQQAAVKIGQYVKTASSQGPAFDPQSPQMETEIQDIVDLIVDAAVEESARRFREAAKALAEDRKPPPTE